MSLNDVLSDTVTRIRNGQSAKLSSVSVIYSKLNSAVLEILNNEGFIDSFTVSEDKRSIEVDLSYSEGKAVIKEIKRVSKPGRRIYSKSLDLKNYFNGLGVAIISTPKGVVTNFKAKELNVGGEVLLTVF